MNRYLYLIHLFLYKCLSKLLYKKVYNILVAVFKNFFQTDLSFSEKCGNGLR